MTAETEVAHDGRRAHVFDTLARMLVAASARGRSFVVVDDATSCSMAFADDLARAIRLAGTPCTRLREADATGAQGALARGAAVPDIGASHGSDQTVAPIVLADGPTWRDHPSRPTPAITVFLRTPGRAAGPGDAQAGDREHGSDIVIDYHDPLWPVIRRVAQGFEHLADELYVSETRAFFANRALRWNDKFGDDLPAYEQAIRESHVPSGGTVVDVGCGTGRALPAIRRAVGDSGVVIGVDLTAEMLAVASVQCNGQFQLLMADARRLPLSSGSVDVVFAAGLLQHLPDPAIGFQELGRITRPGGRLIIFHPSGRAALAARHGRTLRGDETLAAEQLEQLLCGNGWRLTRYDDPPHRFYALAERTALQPS